MRWPQPLRRRATGRAGGRAADVRPAAPVEVERRSPGLGELFARIGPGAGHRLLDLGPASGRSLEVYGRFASQVRFADLGSIAPSGDALPPDDDPYTAVVAWDVLSSVTPCARRELVRRIASRCAPGARLYAVVRGGDGAPATLARSVVIDSDRVLERPLERGSPLPPFPPAEVERALRPFVVVRSFVLRCGAREYVATLAAVEETPG